MSRTRQERLVSAAEAASWVNDGMTISIGGFINSSHPMIVVRELIRRGVRNLTVVGAASAGLEIDLLIAGGCVRKVIAPYVGAEGYSAIAPAFRTAAQRGEIQVWELDEAMYYAGLRAAAQRVPFNPWKSGVGTSYPEVNPDIKVFQDPIRGETLLAIPAIAIEIAFLHAAQSDPYGNVQHVGTGWGDRAHFNAADKTVVQVERVVPPEEIRKDPLRTSIPGAHALIRAPYGSHPYASPGFYKEDEAHIREYVQAVTIWSKDDDRSALDAYLQRYIREPEDHAAYLERVGMRRLLSLQEY